MGRTGLGILEDVGLRPELLRHALLRSVFLVMGSHFGCSKTGWF